MGRNPRAPWKSQSDLLTIDDEDFISDNGEEIWSILENRQIQNVVLVGVYTNMCVLGRPFGLRQMSNNGKIVVLMCDMSDTMYNPQRWPFVSHFQGTDLIVEHIEKFVCPTMTSDQLLGGAPFRFQNDKRPEAVIAIAESLYQTEETLGKFAETGRTNWEVLTTAGVFSTLHSDTNPTLKKPVSISCWKMACVGRRK